MRKLTPYLKLYTDYVKHFQKASALVDHWENKSSTFAAMIREIRVSAVPPPWLCDCMTLTVWLWQCDSVTVWQCDSMSMWLWQCDSMTVWQRDGVTVWQCDSVTVWQYDSMTVWQHDSVTAWQYGIMTDWQYAQWQCERMDEWLSLCDIVRQWRCDTVTLC